MCVEQKKTRTDSDLGVWQRYTFTLSLNRFELLLFFFQMSKIIARPGTLHVSPPPDNDEQRREENSTRSTVTLSSTDFFLH